MAGKFPAPFFMNRNKIMNKERLKKLQELCPEDPSIQEELWRIEEREGYHQTLYTEKGWKLEQYNKVDAIITLEMFTRNWDFKKLLPSCSTEQLQFLYRAQSHLRRQAILEEFEKRRPSVKGKPVTGKQWKQNTVSWLRDTERKKRK